MNSSDTQILLTVVDQAFDKKSWHGTNLRGALRAVTYREACWRPGDERHSIWEIVLHAAYWKYIVRRRLLGEKRGSFPRKGSNWIRPEETTQAVWRRDVTILVETHQSMRRAIAELPRREPPKTPSGSKVSNLSLISGIAAHDLYHAGQIQLLKRLRK